jgi:hypothetical protein
MARPSPSLNEDCSAAECPTRKEISIPASSFFAANVISDTDRVAAAGHVSRQVHGPVGDINADANFGLLPGRRDRSLRRIGAAKHSAGIKAAACVAKYRRSTAVQGIGG